MIMDIADIREHLPHRYPFLLVDRVLELATILVSAERAHRARDAGRRSTRRAKNGSGLGWASTLSESGCAGGGFCSKWRRNRPPRAPPPSELRTWS